MILVEGHGQSLVWSGIDENQEVYQMDSLFTGPDSIMEVRLDDGEIINVEPNSLIFLKKSDDELSLDLRVGSITAQLRPQQSLRLKQGKSITRLKTESKK